MIENLDMNICTEGPIMQKCYSCKTKHSTNHYLVAGDGMIFLCTECLEKICKEGLHRCGYKNIKNKILIKGRKRYEI